MVIFVGADVDTPFAPLLARTLLSIVLAPILDHVPTEDPRPEPESNLGDNTVGHSVAVSKVHDEEDDKEVL